MIYNCAEAINLLCTNQADMVTIAVTIIPVDMGFESIGSEVELK